MEKDFVAGMKQIKSLVQEYKGSKDDQEYEDILFYKETYNNLLSLFNHSNRSEELKNLQFL